MFKSLTLKCPECPDERVIGYQLFERYAKTGFQCECGNLPYYPSQKLFYFADELRLRWKYLPNNGVTPVAKCNVINSFYYGFYVADFAFRIKSQRQVYQAIFKGDSETCKVIRNDSIYIFIKDDLDTIDFHEYYSSDGKWSAVTEFIQLLTRWNREAFDFYKLGGHDILSADICEPPKRRGTGR